ncbi:MAG: hypothetical protein IPN38_09855 [Flavobacteriales bacterium]|nr:hypothetical protein [Flavobacteriales bacterium]
MIRSGLSLSVVLLLSIPAAFAQTDGGAKKEYVPFCIGFYNIENLYDTIDSPTRTMRNGCPAARSSGVPSATNTRSRRWAR